MRITVLFSFLFGDTFPSSSEHQLTHAALLKLSVGQQAEFEVSFCSDQPQTVVAKMTLQVEDNQYNNTIIQLAGEAYQDIISLHDISGPSEETDQDGEEGRTEKEE